LRTATSQNQRGSDAGSALFRWALFCVLILATVSPAAAASAVHRPRPKTRPAVQQTEVLFLSALDPDLPDVAALIEQTETEILTGSEKPVRFSFDYLDFSSSLADTSHKKATELYLADKYRGATFQLVIAIGEETLSFAEQARARLFPDASLLFMVVNPQNEAKWLKPEINRTGVIRKSNYLPTLQLALRQNPGTSRVIVVSGSSEGEKIEMNLARAQFHTYESNLKFEYVTDLGLAELGPRLASVPPDAVIVFLDFVFDANGEQFVPARILPAISKVASRPIYATFSSLVGRGAVGGNVADLSDLGRTLGRGAARILKGEKAENILVTTGDFQHYMIDWRELHRWGIPEDQLPADSVLLNWEYSPWEQYRWRIVGLLAILLIETLLIGLLLRNIVRRRHAQEALARSEKELAEAQRLARIGSWLWDVHKEEILCSEELYRIFGLDPTQPLPRTEEFPKLFTPEGWARLTAEMEIAWTGGSIREIELEAVCPNGSKRWVRVRGEAVSDDAGRRAYLHGTAQDITERKQSDEARSRLVAIVESSEDAIISKNLDGIIMTWNRGAEHTFGFTEEEVVGRHVRILIPPELWGEESALLQKVKAGEKVEHHETIRITKGGQRINVSLTLSPLRSAEGKIIGASKISRNITGSKQAEENLRKSEEKFAKIFRESPSALSLISSETHCYLDVNETFARLSGCTRTELIGTSALEVGLQMDPADRARLTQQLQTDRFFRNAECKYRAKDGRIVIGLTSAELIEISGQGCILGVITDITASKEIEEKLEASQNRMAGIVASAMDAIVAVDDAQRVVLFNAAAEKMFKCPAHRAIGRSIDQFIPVRFRFAHGGHIRRFGETGTTSRAMGTQGTLWALRTDGEEFPIEASISNVEDGEKKLFTVIIRDITERRRAEQAAAESEMRFRLIANTAPVLIWMSGPDKLCNYFNRPWLEFTGRSIEQELGNGWADGVHADDLSTRLDTYTMHFDRHERFSMEYRLRRFDGEYRWVLDIGVPRFNSDGSFAGYVGCCMDISELKQARATVIEFSGRLIRAGEEERARIARELHDDINQRLALLANGLQEVEQRTSGRDPLQKQAVHDLWSLTNEIASDIQHMSHQLHPSKLHYLGLATTVRQLCNEFTQQHKMEIDCVIKGLPDDLDENISLNLFRTVQESLRNVAKHSRARHVRVELTCESNVVRLRISDDGIGFNPEETRIHHGLGLVSMRERLRSIGGEFSIWSKPSLGTLVEGTVFAMSKSHTSELTVAESPDAT
jgi:PAS domain S-box-containing protein